VAVASVKNDELQAQCDMLPKASAEQQEWNEYEPGRKDWTLNTNWLVSAVSDIRKVLTIGTKVKIHVGSRSGYSSTTGVTGFAWVRNCKVNNPNLGLCTGSFIFQGTGPLT
jgi:hypothetical protein